jgi:ectoine hydroxylase-related dioxygenase (phytanoyl-CoA dioxygenase family)
LAIDGGSYECGWHRDIGGEERDGTYEVEMEILGRHRKNLVKWHMALVEDACLWIVPGSQRSYRTDEEREALINNPLNEISTGRQIVLKKGQTVFWTGNTIHRGKMPEGVDQRLTLTGALVKYEEDGPPDKLDERFRWCLADNVRASLPARGQTYYDNWRTAVRA